MGKQLIISIGREFGSGGHEIAGILAKYFDIRLYDKNILQNIANERDLDVDTMEKYDETPRNLLFSRKVKGLSNSAEENIANLQFDYLRKKAKAGESFVVVGRCAETILRDHECMISFFILGDWSCKVDRITRLYDMYPEEAESLILKEDRKRKGYHNYYCKGKWGDSRNYDLSVNSSKLGEEETAKMLIDYIIKRQHKDMD